MSENNPHMYRFKGPVCKIGRIKPKWNINRIIFIRVSKSNVPETKSCIFVALK